jgi:hypothetical protein
MDERMQNLVEECRRQEESGFYTSTSLYEWLKSLRRWRVAFIVLPIVLGGTATWPLLAKQTDWQWLTGLCALLAGITPAVYKALDFDVNLATLAKHAAEFKSLQDRFRQAWRVTALGDFNDFKAEFDELMQRMDDARTASLTPPERFFKKAQNKQKTGDYDFAVDMAKSSTIKG